MTQIAADPTFQSGICRDFVLRGLIVRYRSMQG